MDINETITKIFKKVEALEDRISDMEINLVVMIRDMIGIIDEESKKCAAKALPPDEPEVLVSE